MGSTCLYKQSHPNLHFPEAYCLQNFGCLFLQSSAKACTTIILGIGIGGIVICLDRFECVFAVSFLFGSCVAVCFCVWYSGEGAVGRRGGVVADGVVASGDGGGWWPNGRLGLWT